jgi:hypothetical protein
MMSSSLTNVAWVVGYGGLDGTGDLVESIGPVGIGVDVDRQRVNCRARVVGRKLVRERTVAAPADPLPLDEGTGRCEGCLTTPENQMRGVSRSRRSCR